MPRPDGSARSAAGGLDDRVRRYLRRQRLSPEDTRVQPLTGDASERRYFRLEHAGRGLGILALHREPFEPDTLPFLNVARLFDAMPVPIPAVLDRAGDLGILLLQDLGDHTLQAALRTASPQTARALYRTAVELLVTLQERGRELASAAFLPYGLAFDRTKLDWELDFFARHFLDGHRRAGLSPGSRAALGRAWAPLVETLADEPRVLCHRDYHSRNLMLQDERLYVIDFQDARMGPDTYDLVSLLRDSYVELPADLVEASIDHFLTSRPNVTRDERRVFRQRFDAMALQRHLKALGTFGFQAEARENPAYLEYVPRTLGYLRENLARHAEWAELRAQLARHLPELG